MKLARIASIVFFICSALLFGFCMVTNQSGIDKNGPVITLDQDEIQVSIYDDKSVLLTGITAVDSKDGDVTDSLVVEGISNYIESGRRKYTVVAFDSDNNISRVTRELVYTDYQAPRFSLSGPLRFAFSDNDYTAGLTASDCIDGDLSSKIRITYDDGFSYGVAGEYKLTYTVSNSGGDAIQLPVTVEFYNSGDEISGPQIELHSYLVYIKVGQAVNPSAYIKDVSSYGLEISNLNIENAVNSSEPGVYEVVYRAVDSEGQTGTARLIVVVEE